MKHGQWIILLLSLTLMHFGTGDVLAQKVLKSHALSLHGDVKYGPQFTHFDYVNPDAPKGGTARMADLGTFDSLNPYILKGVPAGGLGLIYSSLLVPSRDEANTEYGELVESIEMPEDRSWVTFTLRANAKWHDGKPVSVEDVIFSLETIKSDGHPFYRSYYGDVVKAERDGERKVKFTFGSAGNRELPVIIGQLPVLPKHYWESRTFGETTLEPPLGNGPYRIESLEAGRYIRYRRVEDFWGKDLPVNAGQHNFDEIRFDYYRDATVAVEALKANEFDFRLENSSKDWATAYDVPALKDGRLIQELAPDGNGTGMQAFWFNTRRGKFEDARVREALSYTFDFEWANKNLFYGQYSRTDSYFSNSELAASGLPTGKELAILEPYRDRIPEAVFTEAFVLPATDGSGNVRDNLRTARNMLADAGWTIQDGKLTNGQSGEVMTIEFLLVSPAFERIVGPVVQNLERLGIDAKIRTVDASQYQNRMNTYDFDMVVFWARQSASPGNEQRDFFSSVAGANDGSRNVAGVADPVVDELIEELIVAPDRETLVAATKALDRVLLHGHYVIPNWHSKSFRLVYWNKFGKPGKLPAYHHGFPEIWWLDTEKSAQFK
ncbi:MAG: ABC transporter substrate-binding protein [Candidatus Latescibacteria bacterium]|nr:ABC transporter substrate-binding protein [Candidatus Latescibacterota bacterium]